jgi:hypothetical protein
VNICSIDNCGKPVRARGWCNTHYWRWHRHGDPLSIARNAPGTGWLSKETGYRFLGKKPEHIVLAEKALGKKLPVGAQVHHVDYNRSNNGPFNLVVCPNQEYHYLLHVRTDAMLACGNPNFRKCRFCGQYDDPVNLRFTPDGNRATPRAFHTKCSQEKQRARRALSKGINV